MKKRILSLLLCAVLLITLLPAKAFAGAPTAFYIGNAINYADSDDSLTAPYLTAQLNNVTMEAWVKADTLSAGNNPVRIMYNGDSSKTGYGIYLVSNQPCILMGSVVFAEVSAVTLTSSEWYHLAAVRNAGVWTLYVNGTGYTPTNSSAAPNALASGDTFSVGNSSFLNELFRGSIDEVRFWTVARTAQQIKDNMYIKLAGSESGLLAYYNFDQEGITPNGNNAGISTVTDVAGGDQPLTISSGFALTGNSSNFVPSVNLGTFALGSDAYSVVKTDGSVAISIVRTGGSEGSVTINYTTKDGTAIAGTDYTATNGRVTFADGQTSKSISVPILDSASTGMLRFSFEISAQSGVSIGTPQSTTVTITPIAPIVTSVTVSPAAANVVKGGTKQFFADLTGVYIPADTVTWSVTGKTSASTGISASGLLSVDSDETAATLTVKATSTVDSTKSDTATVTVADPPPTEYEIIQGQNGIWTQDGTGGLRFTADADYSKLTGVSVDGTALTGEDYSSQSGSTVVTLKAAYLETLSVGRHTLRASFTDGYAETHFIIRSPAVPVTGDGATPALWLMIALLAGAGLAISAVVRRKRQNV